MKLAAWFLTLAACSSTSMPATPDAPSHADARPVDSAPSLDAALDAAGADLACLGLPPPTTAPDPLPVAGKVFAVESYQVAPVEGASVVLRRRETDAIIAEAITAADGGFTMSVASGGAAVDGYFSIAAAGYRPTRVDPGDPLSGGENALMLLARDAELARWYAAAGATFTPDSPTLITAAVDCTHATLGGSTIAVAPTPATVTYYDAVGQHWDATLATSTNGFSLVTGAASAVMVTASVAGTSLPPHAVTVQASALTIAVLSPRTDAPGIRHLP